MHVMSQNSPLYLLQAGKILHSQTCSSAYVNSLMPLRPRFHPLLPIVICILHVNILIVEQMT